MATRGGSVGHVDVVGAGLSGLSAARTLTDLGLDVTVHEASDGVGGRVRTDVVDGFRLDRGFQVFLKAYPTAARLLDLRALDLRAFSPGALIWDGTTTQRLADPLRSPLGHTIAAGLARVGSIADKLRLARLRYVTTTTPAAELMAGQEESTEAWLRREGFSDAMIDMFFRPFLAGVLLDPQLVTSANVTRVLMRAFFSDDVAIPTLGMQAISDQLAEGLDVRLDAEVADLADLGGDAVIVATEAPAAARLLGLPELDRGQKSAASVYFTSRTAPMDEPVLLLDGTGRGPVTHLAVPSLAAPTYSPAGWHLIVANLTGPAATHDPGWDPMSAVAAITAQMRTVFGDQVDGWLPLRGYAIPHGQPAQPTLTSRSPKVSAGVYLAGDHMNAASIEGAVRSGVEAAESLASDLGIGRRPLPSAA